MELLIFSPSDDGEETDVLEYAHDASEPENEDMLSATVSLGMTAGRVRNMLLFKCLRDPVMLALVPETKKMENRTVYLKRLAGDGWEISKFVALTTGQRESYVKVELNFVESMKRMGQT
ncbi:hypothetical protein PPTG_01187 [Phytophthora nicotianae INRA-310]|uniref:Uncharacterized protein n=1 Tax=Phytophthora nicotianae (strain INRA-310) TaxID=761204 RepID=W2RHZ9_PHYN3|nr:hypothetical protein PPTG_01187 [Phytophthora nicotianae INRA-310]ETN25058.1 hypothetical protein PPTG_01187 [Phytophthora nicotianae INRA-310]